MTIEDQPPPTPQPDRVPVWQLVVADFKKHQREEFNDPDGEGDPAYQAVVVDMTARDQLGRERYGTPLTTHNGRDSLIDAYQEQLDLAVYLRTWLEEHPRDSVDISDPKSRVFRSIRRRVREIYDAQISNVYFLRCTILELQELQKTCPDS